MAWLYKHPRSQFWQIGWRVGNKLFNRSTKVANRKEAEKKLALFDLMADANHERRLTDDFYNSLTGRELERITLRDGVEKYLEKCKGTTQPGTFVRYRMVVDSLLAYTHASDTAPLIGDINGETLQQFLNDVRSRTSASAPFFIGSGKDAAGGPTCTQNRVKTYSSSSAVQTNRTGIIRVFTDWHGAEARRNGRARKPPAPATAC
jgi:hypothetical protein